MPHALLKITSFLSFICFSASALAMNGPLLQKPNHQPSSGMHVLLGLVIVLGCIFFLSYLFKKVGKFSNNSQSVIQVVGGVNVGQKEKVVVLEVAGRWLVVGVGAGGVNAIANLTAENTPETNEGVTFSEKFKQEMKNRMKFQKKDNENLIDAALSNKTTK